MFSWIFNKHLNHTTGAKIITTRCVSIYEYNTKINQFAQTINSNRSQVKKLKKTEAKIIQKNRE